jgi:hypothetical protein
MTTPQFFEELKWYLNDWRGDASTMTRASENPTDLENLAARRESDYFCFWYPLESFRYSALLGDQ